MTSSMAVQESLAQIVDKKGVSCLFYLAEQGLKHELSIDSLAEHILESQRIFEESHTLNDQVVQNLMAFYRSALPRIKRSDQRESNKRYYRGLLFSFISSLEGKKYKRNNETKALIAHYRASLCAGTYLADFDVKKAYIMKIDSIKSAQTLFIKTDDIQYKIQEFYLGVGAALLLINNAKNLKESYSTNPFKSKEETLLMAWKTLSVASDAAGFVYHFTNEAKWANNWITTKYRAAKNMEALDPGMAATFYYNIARIYSQIGQNEEKLDKKRTVKISTKGYVRENFLQQYNFLKKAISLTYPDDKIMLFRRQSLAGYKAKILSRLFGNRNWARKSLNHLEESLKYIGHIDPKEAEYLKRMADEDIAYLKRTFGID